MSRFNTLVDALDAAPSDRPFITFWVDEDESETVHFGEFRRRAQWQAHTLRQNGIQTGDRVVIIMPQGIAAMATFVGAMMLGAVPAFLAYPNFKVEPAKYRAGLSGVTKNLGARIIVIDSEFPDDMRGHISLGESSKLLRAADRNDGPGQFETRRAEIPRDALAFIQHSAGTTGLQKGVALTHAAVLRQTDHLANALRVDGASDRIYSWLPLYHDIGLIACFILPMVCHVPVVMQSPLDWVIHPETMLQVVSDHQCTLAWLPNFAFQFVPRRSPQSRWNGYSLSSVRALINCSESVRSASMHEFQKTFSAIGLRNGALQSSYAMAENVFAVTQSDLGGSAGPACIYADGPQFRALHKIIPVTAGTPGAISFMSSGTLLPHHEIRILSESGQVLPEACVGEIQIKSDCLFDGYYNRPDLTREAFIDGWYRSGDLGFQLNRELFVIGRKKDLLVIGGENIYPQDIEEAVTSHPAIHDGRAIALGVFNPDLGTEQIVVVAEVEREELLVHAAEIEQEIRNQVVAATGVSVRTIILKPPKWIVKSTAGKAARAATREKLFNEHPELNVEAQEQFA